MKNRLSVRFFRLALRAYPLDFRTHNGDEMLRVFGEGLNAVGNRGAGAATAYFVHILGDLLRAAVRERVATTDRGFWLAASISSVFAIYIAEAEHHAFQALPMLGVLLISAAIIGGLRPRGTWRWAVVLAACVPVAHFLVGELHFGHRPFLHIVVVEAAVMTVASTAALASAYATVFLRSYVLE